MDYNGSSSSPSPTTGNPDPAQQLHLHPGETNSGDTAGKPITCTGWVAAKGCSSWSSSNVKLSSHVVIPVPQPHQVRIKVLAAGLNPVDVQRTMIVHNTSSQPASSSPQVKAANSTHMYRRLHAPPFFEFPYICGIEGAGVVESIGGAESDSELHVGDRVMYLADITKGTGGSFCQYAVVDRDTVVKLDESEVGRDVYPLDFVEAATLPAAAATAYLALFDKLRVETGRSIFISGASGGVGSCAVQLAHHFGLYVFASCSTPNIPFVQRLGADCVLDYTRMNVVTEVLRRTDGYGVDFLLETASAGMAEEHAETVRFGGSLCVLTGLLLPSCDVLFRRQLSVHYVFLGMMHSDPLARPLLRLLGRSVRDLYTAGAFAVYAEEVPFERADVALSVIAQGHTRGKVVLTGFHEAERAEERRRRNQYKRIVKKIREDMTKSVGK